MPGGPYAIVAGDFTGNGQIDLAVADHSSSTVTILLGNGDGTFDAAASRSRWRMPNPPQFPDAIVAGNFTGNGHLDLAVADRRPTTSRCSWATATARSSLSTPISLGRVALRTSMSLVAGDFRNNGLTDLAVATTDFVNGDSVDVLLGNGDGTFQAPRRDLARYRRRIPSRSSRATSPTTASSTWPPPIATAIGTDDYSVYLGNGDGTFQRPTPYALGGAGVFDRHRRRAISPATARPTWRSPGRVPTTCRCELSNGDGTFSDPSVVDLARRETPLVADFNGDGTPDVSVVDAAGDILYRAGRPGEPGSFAPPVTVNPGDPSRDIAFVSTEYGPDDRQRRRRRQRDLVLRPSLDRFRPGRQARHRFRARRRSSRPTSTATASPI